MQFYLLAIFRRQSVRLCGTAPRDLFCAILTHSPHLSGGHISEQDTQSHHCCLAKPLNVFHRGARTTCRILLLTVPQLLAPAFLCQDSETKSAPDVSQLNLKAKPTFLACRVLLFTPQQSVPKNFTLSLDGLGESHVLTCILSIFGGSYDSEWVSLRDQDSVFEQHVQK